MPDIPDRGRILKYTSWAGRLAILRAQALPDRTDQVPAPARVLALRIVAPKVYATGFLPDQGRPDHQAGNREQVLQLPAQPGIKFACQGIATPELYILLGLK